MLQQSGILTLLGMGIVFSFLIIMVIIISLFGKFVNTRGVAENNALPASSGTVNRPEITAVISAAVNEYRKDETNSGGKV